MLHRPASRHCDYFGLSKPGHKILYWGMNYWVLCPCCHLYSQSSMYIWNDCSLTVLVLSEKLGERDVLIMALRICLWFYHLPCMELCFPWSNSFFVTFCSTDSYGYSLIECIRYCKSISVSMWDCIDSIEPGIRTKGISAAERRDSHL